MTRRRTIILLIAAALLAAVGLWAYWESRGRVAVVEPARLYRSAALSATRLLEVCRRYRITTVVDFRDKSAETAAEAEVLARAGIEHVSLPTPQVPSADTVARFLRVMDDKRGQAVLIHCEHGVGRTGLFSAIYRMGYQGWPAWRAIAEAWLLAGFGSFGPRSEKTTYLLGYVPRHSLRIP